WSDAAAEPGAGASVARAREVLEVLRGSDVVPDAAPEHREALSRVRQDRVRVSAPSGKGVFDRGALAWRQQGPDAELAHVARGLQRAALGRVRDRHGDRELARQVLLGMK